MSKKTVYLSPSTQENNIGAGSYGTEEYRMNQLCDLLQVRLVRKGYIVLRNSPRMSLRQVVEDSNNRKPDIHVAIHSNAFNKVARGAEVYCYKFGTEGERLAGAIFFRLSEVTPTADRGVKEGKNFFGEGKHLVELSDTHAPSVIAEIAFHDNADDARHIVENFDLYADAIYDGINDFFRVPTTIEEIEELRQLVQEQQVTIEAHNRLIADIKALSNKYLGGEK